MKNAILLHGKPGRDEYYDANARSASNSHWLPWLQKQLLIHDIPAQTPEIPNSWKPHYPSWQHEFERYEVSDDTMLVGHSRGAAFLVRWLSENPHVRVGKMVLVAPAIIMSENDDPHFFDCDIDANLASRTRGLTIFHSDNDKDGVVQSVATLRQVLKDISYREFHNYGHFTFRKMGTEEFPELLNTLLS